MEKLKEYKVIYKSRYYPYEGERFRTMKAPSKKSIYNNWHSIIGTDEYLIVRCEEVK